MSDELTNLNTQPAPSVLIRMILLCKDVQFKPGFNPGTNLWLNLWSRFTEELYCMWPSSTGSVICNLLHHLLTFTSFSVFNVPHSLRRLAYKDFIVLRHAYWKFVCVALFEVAWETAWRRPDQIHAKCINMHAKTMKIHLGVIKRQSQCQTFVHQIHNSRKLYTMLQILNSEIDHYHCKMQCKGHVSLCFMIMRGRGFGSSLHMTAVTLPSSSSIWTDLSLSSRGLLKISGSSLIINSNALTKQF